MTVSFDHDANQWAGLCPRCGRGGFFPVVGEHPYGVETTTVLRCSAKHQFVVEHGTNHRDIILGVFPNEYEGEIPYWLPDDFRSCYQEMLKEYHGSNRRAAIALCGILLEGAVNDLITSEQDKKKSLYDRLEALKNLGKIEADQFSDGTIARLTRKGVVHPKDITAEPSQDDVEEVFQAVNSFLERTYKWRSSKALPAARNTPDVKSEDQ